MKGKVCFALALTLLCSNATANCAQGNNDADLAKLQGDWVVISSKNRQQFDFAGHLQKFEKSTWQSYNRSGQSEGVYTIVIRPEKMPKEIDFTIIKPKAGKILMRGIYSFSNDQLIIAISANRNMNVRPEAFDVIGGPTDIGITILERKKEKKEGR